MSSSPPRPSPGPSTVAIHGCQPEDWTYHPLVVPLYLTASYKYPDPERQPEILYERYGNPTRHALEKTVAALEGGKYALCFASGMTAFTAVAEMLHPGDHVICSNQIYGGVALYLEEYAPGKGIEVTFVDAVADPENLRSALKKNTKLVWVEICGNPNLGILDIDRVSEIVCDYNKDIILGVDNTFLSPILIKPLEHGVTIVMHSMTKYLAGHGDLIMGCLTTNRQDLYQKLYQYQKNLGLMAHPLDCFLVARSLKTLSLRVRQHGENAAAVARFLETHSMVDKVSYPGLPCHPQHQLAKRLLSGFGGMVTFSIKGNWQAVMKLGRALKIFTCAVSLGSTDSLVSFPWNSSHYMLSEETRRSLGVTENLVRLSVGIEDVQDLIHDLDQALNAIKNEA